MITKPIHLKRGDMIGLLSPSSGMAGLVPHRTERAEAMLREMGFKVRLAPNALKTAGHVSSSAEERAADIHELFRDPEIKAIISFIGGNHSNQLLKHLDFDLIASHPKVFVGYSDITVLHFAFLTQANMVSFYGPAALTQFGENPQVLPYTKEWFEKALMHTDPIGRVMSSGEWTDEILNWFTKEDLERPRTLKTNGGYQWLREGKAEGPIIGGCITSMLHLRGTKYWPDFTGSLLLWEIPESDGDFTKGEPPSNIDAHLADLENSDVFDAISGMIIGRPFGYTQEETDELKDIILERTKGYAFPILFNVDVGHSDPMITVPLGINAKIDSLSNSLTILEAGVQ